MHHSTVFQKNLAMGIIGLVIIATVPTFSAGAKTLINERPGRHSMELAYGYSRIPGNGIREATNVYSLSYSFALRSPFALGIATGMNDFNSGTYVADMLGEWADLKYRFWYVAPCLSIRQNPAQTLQMELSFGPAYYHLIRTRSSGNTILGTEEKDTGHFNGVGAFVSYKLITGLTSWFYIGLALRGHFQYFEKYKGFSGINPTICIGFRF